MPSTRYTVPAILILLLLLTVLPSVQARVNLEYSGRWQADGLFVEAAEFYDPDSSMSRLEVYWQIYNPAVTFEAVGGQFRASYDLNVRVRDRRELQVGSYNSQGEIAVETEERTMSHTDFRTGQASFWLDPGKYVVDFTLRDSRSSVVRSREIKVKLAKPKRKNPWLSDIEAVNIAMPAEDTTSSFLKGNMIIIPSLTGEFGERQNNRVRFYFEVYQGESKADSVFVETALRQHWGRLAYRDSMTIALDGPVSRQLREISIGELEPGPYSLEVRLRGRKHRKVDESHTEIVVEWSTSALREEQFATTIQLLRLIADPGQLDRLKGLESEEDRRSALKEFWDEWDPTPGTDANEIRVEFYRRVKVANRAFGFRQRAGWRTDRGIVLIHLGEPDEIDDYPMVLDGFPYQEWHYHRFGDYQLFRFVDEVGDGDYRLVYPYDGLNVRPSF